MCMAPRSRAQPLSGAIDLAVISPDFSPDLSQEGLALMHLAAQMDDRIEPQPFTPQDFNASDPLASEIQDRSAGGIVLPALLQCPSHLLELAPFCTPTCLLLCH